MRPGVRLTTSANQPTGGGATDPHILLNEFVTNLDGHPLSDFLQDKITYDTFDGRNKAKGKDSYTLHFPEPVLVNCLDMTMGFPYRDGGWWTTINVEFQKTDHSPWESVANLQIYPQYPFDNSRDNRLPLQTYTLTFDPIQVNTIRIIGNPGGSAEFTSLSRLAAYQRDLSHWNPTIIIPPPIPRLYQLITPKLIFSLSENLYKLTGLSIESHMLEYYLDAEDYLKFWSRTRHNYEGEPELWILIGDVIGWRSNNQYTTRYEALSIASSSQPYIQMEFHDNFIHACAPIMVEGEWLGMITTNNVLVKQEQTDWDFHRTLASQYHIPWDIYHAAHDRMPKMTVEQMIAAAEFLGLIANTLANLAHKNWLLEFDLISAKDPAHQRKKIVRQAIDFMEENLERSINVNAVANAIALSPSYFSEVFTRETGKNPRDWLINLKLERAKQYLSYTSMSVTEVCEALQYDPAYFSRLFKRRFNTTPLRFAQRMRKSP